MLHNSSAQGFETLSFVFGKLFFNEMPCPEADPGLAREVQLQREAAEWCPPTKAEEIPLAAEEDIPVIDVGRYLEAYKVRFTGLG